MDPAHAGGDLARQYHHCNVSDCLRRVWGACIASSLIKLLDFGMAGFMDEHGQLRGRCGTPGYVAPEI